MTYCIIPIKAAEAVGIQPKGHYSDGERLLANSKETFGKNLTSQVLLQSEAMALIRQGNWKIIS